MSLLNVDEITGKVKAEIKTAIEYITPIAADFAKEQKEAFVEAVDDMQADLNSSLAFIAFCNTAGKFIITGQGADGKPSVQYRKADHLKAFKAITDAFNEIVDVPEEEGSENTAV